MFIDSKRTIHDFVWPWWAAAGMSVMFCNLEVAIAPKRWTIHSKKNIFSRLRIGDHLLPDVFVDSSQDSFETRSLLIA